MGKKKRLGLRKRRAALIPGNLIPIACSVERTLKGRIEQPSFSIDGKT